VATSDTSTTAPNARLAAYKALAIAALFAIATVAGAVGVLNSAVRWWGQGQAVSATVTQVPSDEEGNTYEVDYDGIRGKVGLVDAHEVGDAVEVRFNPLSRDKITSESDAAENLIVGLMLVSVGAFVAIALVRGSIGRLRAQRHPI